MNAIVVLCILVSLPMTMALNCYVCSGLTDTACNDPFKSTGTGVTQSGSNSNNTYCTKNVAFGIVSRNGAMSCNASSISFPLNIGTACCQTDLCNAAYSHYQISIWMIIGLIAVFIKIQWV